MLYLFFSLNPLNAFYFSPVSFFVCIFVLMLFSKVIYVGLLSQLPHCKLLEGKDYIFISLVSSSALKMVVEKN